MVQLTKAFSGYSVDDLERAKKFYNETLGIKVVDDPMALIELQFEGGNNVILYPKPNHTPATFTVLNFPVNDIDETVDELTSKGVLFEQYEGDIQTDEKGICRGDERLHIAWFKDPAGNILSVLEEKR